MHSKAIQDPLDDSLAMKTLKAPPAVSSHRSLMPMLATQIAELVLRKRRIIDGHAGCAATPCRACLSAPLDKINALIERRLPIHFILPAFPAKSPNLSKVLGPLPDLGERISLQDLNRLCAQIGELYSPGARITICSDGRVFSDCVGVSDEDVSRYGQHIKDIIDEYGCTNIDVFRLEDHFKDGDFDAIRRRLVAEHGRTIEELKELLKSDPETKNMFNGIHRFMYTDLKARRPEFSNSKLREGSKDLAYHVIIRSNAWSGLVESLFPSALRLSIHPQHPHSRKIGIKLMECDDIWRTPWHGAVLDDGQKYRLMSRGDIEKLPVDLVYEKGRPLYYVLRRYQHESAAAAV
jgi:pyoverdine/dityrosine biosynthesis protein Dit1